MYYRIITTTILALLIWQIILQNQGQVKLDKQLQTLSHSLVEEQAAKSLVMAEQLTVIQESIEKMEKKNREEFKGKIESQAKTIGLYQTLSQLSKSERLAKAGQMAEAAELVLSTKGAVWKAGDTFSDHKDTLHGMMGPIDVLAAKWNGGDKEGTANNLILKIDDITNQLGK